MQSLARSSQPHSPCTLLNEPSRSFSLRGPGPCGVLHTHTVDTQDPACNRAADSTALAAGLGGGAGGGARPQHGRQVQPHSSGMGAVPRDRDASSRVPPDTHEGACSSSTAARPHAGSWRDVMSSGEWSRLCWCAAASCCLLPQVPLGPNYKVPHMLQITNGHWTPEAALTRAHELVTALVSSKLGTVAPLDRLAGRQAGFAAAYAYTCCF